MLDEATTGMQAHLVKKHALDTHLEKNNKSLTEINSQYKATIFHVDNFISSLDITSFTSIKTTWRYILFMAEKLNRGPFILRIICYIF